jgi:hypothetical protein
MIRMFIQQRVGYLCQLDLMKHSALSSAILNSLEEAAMADEASTYELSPPVQAEIESIAHELERFGLRRMAARLRALLGPLPDDERPCPIRDPARQVRAIPWGLAEILYPAYGRDQMLERIAERGGFGRGELGMLAADCYGSTSRPRPRLREMPLLTLYRMTKRK